MTNLETHFYTILWANVETGHIDELNSSISPILNSKVTLTGRGSTKPYTIRLIYSSISLLINFDPLNPRVRCPVICCSKVILKYFYFLLCFYQTLHGYGKNNSISKKLQIQIMFY